jgi:hypothetical protein
MADTGLIIPPIEATYDPAYASAFSRGELAGTPVVVPTPAPEEPPRVLPVGMDRATGKMFVNGLVFDPDDHRSALESQEYLKQPEVEMPGNYSPLPSESYRNYIRGIKDPSSLRLFAKNFGIGVDATQMLLYGAAQAVGRGTGIGPVERFGERGVERNVGELSFNEPYQRRFTNIEGAGDFGEWFIANLGQVAPSIAETLIAAGIGAVVGMGTAGPGGALVGLGAGVVAKGAAKKALTEQVRAALAKRAAGQALEVGEKALLKRVSTAGGALVGSALNSYALGVGDIFTEGEAEGEGSVWKALTGGVLYGAADLAPQLALLTRATRGLRDGLKSGTRAKRAATGFVGGATLEGGTEAFQELLVMGATGQLDFNNPEVTNRLIDAFAAGAGIGGPLGSIVNAFGRTKKPNLNSADRPVDLLRDENLPAQGELFGGQDLGDGGGPGPRAGLRPGQQGELFAGQDLGTYPATAYNPDQGDLFRGMDLGGRPVSGQQLEMNLLPPVDTGGLPLFDRQAAGFPDVPRPARPAQREMFPGQNLGTAPATYDPGTQLSLPLEDTRQRELPFAAPEGTRVDTAIAQAFERAQQKLAQEVSQPLADAAPPQGVDNRTSLSPQDVGRQLDFAQAEQQRAAQQNRLLDQQRAAAEAQRAAQAAQAAQPAQTVLPPFNPQPSLPGLGPSYSERLRMRRRVPAEPEAAPVETTPSGQLKLFDTLGRPTVNALRAAGKKRKVDPEQTVDRPSDVEANAEADDVAAQKAAKLKKGKKDAVQKQSAATVDAGEPTGPRSEDGTGDIAERDAAGDRKETGTKAAALKRGRKSGGPDTKAKDTPKTQPAGRKSGGPDTKAKDTPKTQPAGRAKPEPAKQEVEQPTELKVEQPWATAAEAWEHFRRQLRSEEETVIPPDFEYLQHVPGGREARKKWEKMFSGPDPITIDEFEDVIEPLDTTARGAVINAQFIMEEPSTQEQFRAAVETLVEVAVSEGGQNAPKQEAVKVLLSDVVYEPWQQEIVGDVILDELHDKAKLTNGGVQLFQNMKGGGKQPTTRLVLLRHYGLLDRAAETVQFAAPLPPELGAAVAAAAEADLERLTRATKSTKALAAAIQSVLDEARRNPLGGVAKDMIRSIEGGRDLIGLTGSGKRIDFEYLVDGSPIRSWLSEDRKHFNWEATDSRNKFFYPVPVEDRVAPAPKKPSPAQKLKKGSDPLADRSNVTFEELKKRFGSPPEDGRTRRMGSDEEITAPLSMGRVKLLVQKARNAFKGAAPKIYVFKNVDELKRKNPALYREAASRRPQGDFDSIRASGYSYDDKVFLFADNIRDARELAFTLAHETLGHLGMRAVFAPAEFRALMDRVYLASSQLRSEADALVETTGMDRYEAIEEVIADYAAWLDNSVLGLLRKAYRGFMNRLGVQYEDDDLRLMVAQSRRYLRTGQTSGMTTPAVIMHDIHSLVHKAAEGRFKAASDGTHAVAVSSLGVLSGVRDGTGLAGGLAAAYRYWKASGTKDMGRSIGIGLEQFQSMANASGRSAGLREVFGVFQAQTHFVRSVQAKIAERISYTQSNRWFGLASGPTEKQKLDAGNLMAIWALYSNSRLTETALRDSRPLIVMDESGYPQVDEEAVLEAKAASGLWTKNAAGKWEPNFADVRRQMEQGVSFEYIDEKGAPRVQTMSHPAVDDQTWNIFLEMRDAVDFAAVESVHAKMIGFFDDRQAEMSRLTRMKDADGVPMDEKSMAFLQRVADHFQTLYDRDMTVTEEGVRRNHDRVKEANRWLDNVTVAIRAKGSIKFSEWEKAVAGQTVPDGEITQVVLDAPQTYQWVVDGLRHIRTKRWTDNQSLRINKALAGMHLLSTQATNADLFARRTIMGSYAAFVRKGKYQVKIAALDEDGNEVRLPDGVASDLPYFKVESGKERDQIVERLRRDVLGLADGENEKEVSVQTFSDKTGKPTERQTYRLVIRWGEAPDVKPLHEAINYDQFVQTLTRLGIGLDPKERERAVEALTASHSLARKNLMRTATPGWDPDVVSATAEHLETVSHIAGKNRYRHRLRRIMDDDSLWNGSNSEAKQRLAALQDGYRAAKASGNEAAISSVHRELVQYQRMMLHMTKGGDTVGVMSPDMTVTAKPGKGQANTHRAMATDLVDFYDNALDIAGDPVTGAVGKYGGALITFTAAAQLGMSIATAAVNLGSLGTHTIPYLASYNEKLGYGGGFGMAAATVEVTRALNQIGATWKISQLADPTFLTSKEMRNKGYEKYGLSRAEYDMLVELSREGVLQANMFNAMIGTTRADKKTIGPSLEGWMKPFTVTEQLNRRATALATYRLERRRMEQQGLPLDETSSDPAVRAEAEKNTQRLYQLTTDAVNYSQGEYAQYNRSALARGSFTQFLFMYKQFVIITIENLRNMGWSGTVMSLVMLAIVSGLKGMPFGDDLMDLVDTLIQKFGIKMLPIEAEIAGWVNSVLPGAAPYVLHGVADQWLDVMVSSRFGMGDLLPLTGAAKAGADVTRELTNFFGPVASSVTGMVALANGLVKYGAEVVGLREDTTSFVDLLRDSPIAGLRSLTDGLSYMADGSIINTRGQVVSKDVGVVATVGRLLGFYPHAASSQYDVIRLARQTDEYAAALKLEYTNQYLRAKSRGDERGAREVVQLVNKWNRGAINTPFFIRNFGTSAARAAKEANRSAIDRYFKSSPLAGRETTRQLIKYYGLDDKTELAR